MNHLDFTAAGYNYYPNTMIQLCVISYDDIGSIANDVSSLTDQTVVWGPAELVSSWDISYSLAYITKRNTTNEYTLVIRGTNMDSWTSWTTEDFSLSTLQPLNQLVPGCPANAMISQGTFNGMNDLLSLVDPNTNQSLTDFLLQTKPYNLYVTGHSLGGTLTPPMYAYLEQAIFKGTGWMTMFSFAGLTSGNQAFANYIDTIMSTNFPWRMQNTLDIAPFCFWSQSGLENIYVSNGLTYGFPEDDLFDPLFSDAGNNYVQPSGGNTPITGTFNTSIWDEYLWATQAMYQHHSTTYQSMVANYYPTLSTTTSG